MHANATAVEAMDPAQRLIVALDGMGADQALELAAALPQLRWVKVGLELFVAAGPPVVQRLRQQGLRVFLDLKFHDIPNTVEQAVEAAPVRASLPKACAVESVSLEDVIALRTELLAHQQEVARLSAQLQELKSMVGSQQQVLVYLGQELETQQMPIRSAAAQAAPPAKKARVVRAKSASKAPSALRTSPCEPSLNL